MVYSHARSHAGLRARNERSRLSVEGGSRSLRLSSSPVYASGATPSLVVGHGWRLVPTNPPAMAICAQSRSCRAYTCPANAFAFLALDVFVDEIDMGSTRGRLARWTGTCQRSCREGSLIVIMTRFNQLAELIFVRANMPLGRRLA